MCISAWRIDVVVQLQDFTLLFVVIRHLKGNLLIYIFDCDDIGTVTS